MTVRPLSLVLLALIGLAIPHAGRARTLEVGPTREFQLPSAAIAAAVDGDQVLIDGGTYVDCASVRANNLTIEGRAPDAAATLRDRSCAGKGILITTGNHITIRNLTLAGAVVPDNNGAGIRAEGTDLLVDQVRFLDNQDGMLINANPASTVTVHASEFLRNGVCNPICAHGIYAGLIKLLRVEGSRFSDTRQGHHIKSRAARTEIVGNTITDGPTGTASYLIDIPNGGAILIQGNTLEKGPASENRCCGIMLGAEGITLPTPDILIADNRFRVTGDYRPAFVENRTATPAKLIGNVRPDNVRPLRGPGRVE